MSKIERILFYSLFVVSLVFGFMSNSSMQARQETEFFSRIVVTEIGVVNSEGVEVISIGTSSEGNANILICDKNDSIGIIISTDVEGSSIFMPNKDGSLALGIVSFEGGAIVISDEYGNKTKFYGHN